MDYLLSMKLTQVEKKMLDALQIVLGCLTQRYLYRKEFLALMDTVRVAIQAGINKQWAGCESGLHSTDCTCTKNKEGQNFSYWKYDKDHPLKRGKR